LKSLYDALKIATVHSHLLKIFLWYLCYENNSFLLIFLQSI